MTWPEMQMVDLETFQALDDETRALILRLLREPTETDFAALEVHPQGETLASWLLSLPAYLNARDDEDSPRG